jgi:hypothetical protein
MPTLGQAVHAFEERVFVGRERELSVFDQWLSSASGATEILSVSGPGGVGKSTLLRAFRRRAEASGWSVIAIDGHNIRPVPESLIEALGGTNLESAVSRLNQGCSLLLLDGYEGLVELTRFLLDELLPGLETTVRIVIAGRHPLLQAWGRDDGWQQLIRPLPLSGLGTEHARAYLVLCGLEDRPGLMEEIYAATRGFPLGLSLAADLARRRHLEALASVPEWPLTLRMLVERMRETEDLGVGELLETASVLRQFDEGALEAVLARAPEPRAFERLCGLSLVRPVERGLMLYDEVRRILAADLRWRNPERHTAYRKRALAHQRTRMSLASGLQREQLLAERFALWEDAFLDAMLFTDTESGEAWLSPGGPDDRDDIERIWGFFLAQVLPADMHPTSPDGERAFLSQLLDYPELRVRIARDETGRALGFSLSIPVCRDSMEVLDAHPGIASLAHAYLQTPDAPTELPEDPADATLFYLLHSAHTDVLPQAVSALLLRELFAIVAGGLTYLASTPIPMYQNFFVRMGWEHVPAARNWSWSSTLPVEGYVLDLTRIGVEAWIEATMAGRPAPRGLASADFERELHGVLLHWRDSSWVVSSVLWDAPPFALIQSDKRDAEAMRDLIERALAGALVAADADLRPAYRAIQLAYLTRGVSHEAAAERLSVSRATLYRLLKRGVHALAVRFGTDQGLATGPGNLLRP